MTTFALISDTKLVAPRDLFVLSKALEINAKHCAIVWGRQIPSVVVVDSWEKLPKDSRRTIHPILFTEQNDGENLAEHFWDPSHRGPSARVYVTGRSELRFGPYSLAESAAHEVVEAMVDPMVNVWMDYPGRHGVEMALEIADMTQDTYEVDVDGTGWPVANFVTPDYFEAKLLPDGPRKAFLAAGGRFDHAGRMKMPGEILPTGYAILRRPKDGGGYSTYPVYGTGMSMGAERLSAKKHPWSRSAQRGCLFQERVMAAKKKMDSERPPATKAKNKPMPKPKAGAMKGGKKGRIC